VTTMIKVRGDATVGYRSSWATITFGVR